MIFFEENKTNCIFESLVLVSIEFSEVNFTIISTLRLEL